MLHVCYQKRVIIWPYKAAVFPSGWPSAAQPGSALLMHQTTHNTAAGSARPSLGSDVEGQGLDLLRCCSPRLLGTALFCLLSGLVY